ncbi:MAG: HEPN domain-containing protein [Rhizobiales bacterium]|nr:HEPN domain-containing protein [Hyphomicrobiales bacterium]
MGEYLSNKCAEVVVLHSVIADAGESDLERINPFSFYEFASKLHAVSALSGEVSTRAGFWPIWQARNAMETLIKGDPIPIGISSGKAQTLRERLDNVMKDRFETTDQKGEKRIRFPEESDQPIAGYMIDWIKSGITEFETVFAEEMRETATYFVPRRGIYWTPALVDSADETFPKELLSFIPQKAREDWKSAGRCLAFNLLSASGFHVARAVEACLESYYGLFSGKPGETLHSWYDYIKALKEIAAKEPTPCPLAKTLVELDQMREDYRNPIVHPRVVLSEGDARMLFANGESLIIAMAQEIALAATGIQPALALVGGKEAGGEAS